MRRTALAAVILSMTMLCGCMEKNISAVNFDKFSKTLLEEGYCAEDSISTTDTEDGTSSVVLTDNGWVAVFYECADEEIAEIEPKLPEMEEQIKILLLPADPDDSKNAIVEIRGGTGGDEAAIFAGDLFRMYSKFAESRGWKLS